LEEHLRPSARKAIAYLEESGYRYALIGGIALSQWGEPRYTHDVDIKVLVPDIDYAKTRIELRSAFPTPARQHLVPNPLIVAVEIEGVIVDFLLALPGYEENIITRAVQRDLGGWQAWICSAEDLIIQKVIAGRGKDWMDIEGLLIEQHGKLDLDYVEDWLTQFVQALELPELLSEYRRVFDKVESLFEE